MKITVGDKVLEKFPGLRIRLMLFSDIDNALHLKESKHLLKEAEELVRLTFHKETVKNHNLISPWEVVRQKFGVHAKHYHTSVERLMRDVLSKKKISTDSTVTNLVRYVSIKHIIPLGIDDSDKIKGDLTFSIATGKERSNVKLQKGELYYRDAGSILGRKLDFWKSKKTLPTKKTQNVLVHLEALPPITNKKLQEVSTELASLIQGYCGGKVKMINP